MEFTMYSHFQNLLMEQGPEAAADRAKELGFSSVEVLESTIMDHPMAIPDVETARKVRRIFESRGLRFACYSVGTTLYQNPAAEQFLYRHAELAAALGSPFLHHTSYLDLVLPPDAPSFDDAIEYLTAAACRVADYAKPLGITCIYEDQGMYTNGLEGFSRFFSKIKSRCTNVGVCGDVGNIMFVDEEPAPFFEAFAQDIKHVHIKDYLRKAGPVSPGMYWLPTKGGNWLRDTMVGHGTVDFAACMKTLKDVGYQGALAFETNHPEPYEAGVQQAMDYLNRYL